MRDFRSQGYRIVCARLLSIVSGGRVMKRRDFVALLGGAAAASAALPLSARAQTPAKIPRIAYIATANTAMGGRMAAALRQGLSELGYIDGQTIAIEVRVAD